jgi:hypothetical protein
MNTIIIVLIIIIIIFFIVAYNYKKEKRKYYKSLQPYDKNKLKKGDLIFFVSTNWNFVDKYLYKPVKYWFSNFDHFGIMYDNKHVIHCVNWYPYNDKYGNKRDVVIHDIDTLLNNYVNLIVLPMSSKIEFKEYNYYRNLYKFSFNLFDFIKIAKNEHHLFNVNCWQFVIDILRDNGCIEDANKLINLTDKKQYKKFIKETILYRVA